MKINNLLLVAAMTLILTGSVYAAQGDVSLIPKIKAGGGQMDDPYYPSYKENMLLSGVAMDLLYKIDHNIEVGAGFGIDHNEFEYYPELDFTSFNIYGITRYNLSRSGYINPYFSAKIGVNIGEASYTEYIGGTPYNTELNSDLFVGLAFGVEFNYLSFEFGYELTNVDVEDEYNNSNISTDYDAFYTSIGYRFN